MSPALSDLALPLSSTEASAANLAAVSATSPTPKIAFVSLGCPKALVDSERIVTQLRAEGYAIRDRFQGADLAVVNTCGFVDDAIAESLSTIGEALSENGRVIVTGCLGAKLGEHRGEALIRERHPQVLAITGPHATQEVLDLVHTHLPKPHDAFSDLIPAAGIKLTPAHFAYLKISEGCNHDCSFCIIPAMRGKLDSRPIGEVLNEAEKLLQSGVKELLVVSQDTSAYGVDIKYRTGFWQGRPLRSRLVELSAALGQLAVQYGDAWVRLHYVYPYPQVDELMAQMNAGHVLPYLDVPLQHAHPRVLAAMRRPASGEKFLQRMARWRAECPQLVLRSTFIVGFPGETEAEFEFLLDFLREAQLDRVGCFAYSPVDGASANELPDPVPQEEREARLARFMQVAEAISSRKLQARVGKVMRVLVDKTDRGGAVARSYADAPEIDGRVLVAPATRASKRPRVGEFVDVLITGVAGHDLVGQVA